MPFIVSTKKDKDADAIETNLTIVFDNAEVERALATRQCVVDLQAGWRKNGIPANAVVKLSELRTIRKAAAPMTPESILANVKAGTLDKAAVLKMLQSM